METYFNDYLLGGEGGVLGNVIQTVTSQKTVPTPGVVAVLWDMSNDDKAVNHNCGKDGRVEIQYETPASGGYYYPDHLLVLDEKNFSSLCAEGTRQEDDDENEICSSGLIVSDASGAHGMLSKFQ